MNDPIHDRAADAVAGHGQTLAVAICQEQPVRHQDARAGAGPDGDRPELKAVTPSWPRGTTTLSNGRPADEGEAVLRDFILAGGKVQWHALTDELADATFTHPQTGEAQSTGTSRRAMTALREEGDVRQVPAPDAAQPGVSRASARSGRWPRR